MTEYRTCEKLVDGHWVPIEFDDIKEGDHIKLWEKETILIREFIATADAEPCSPEGNMQVGGKPIFIKEEL